MNRETPRRLRLILLRVVVCCENILVDSENPFSNSNSVAVCLLSNNEYMSKQRKKLELSLLTPSVLVDEYQIAAALLQQALPQKSKIYDDGRVMSLNEERRSDRSA